MNFVTSVVSLAMRFFRRPNVHVVLFGHTPAKESTKSQILKSFPAVASACAALISAHVAIKSIQISSIQANTAREALILSNRPWLTVNVKLLSGLVLQKNGTLSLTISQETKNVGRSPALNVKSYVIYDHQDWNAANAIKTWCHPQFKTPLFLGSFDQQVIWPERELPAQQSMFYFKPDELAAIDTGKPNSELLFVVQCIEFEISGDRNLHHSDGAWRLFKLRADGPGNEGFPTDRSTALQQLSLGRGWASEAAYTD